LPKASRLRLEGETATDRLVEICQAFSADRYLSGTLAVETYMGHEPFELAGIEVLVQAINFVPYKQVHGGEFISHLSIIDMMMNIGAAGTRQWIDDNISYRVWSG